ncbi:glycosyltransferase family 2 protein [Sulfitobacter mediterraneus]|uniref:glycosyltransferase family 2 protein n=1 Tax=Sulfitobacter mediterraneus TaxID=83219 RepID=UPI000EA12A6D|nr:glycosyltransferase family 2 protein [Sulfitobacter mediterraneus]
MKSPIHLMRRALHKMRERRRRQQFARSLRHLHGPAQLNAGADEVVLIALVRNGSYYLDAFFAHYRAMGIRHFVFIDNGSTDDTLTRIAAEPGTIIDQSALPLAGFEDLIRQYPANTYGQNRWCLYVDMDEVFDFEGRESLGMDGLIAYLNGQGATAMVAQMLEMFPKAPLREVAHLPYAQVLEEFSYFDISTVDKYDYHSTDIPFSELLKDNTNPNRDIQFCFGGVRGKVFGEACCLTKHPLIFNGPDVTPAPHPHLSMGVTCADITGVIKHYKFANDPGARDAASLGAGDVAHGEDARRAAVMRNVPDVTLFSLDARPWNRVELLIRAGFVVGSKAFSEYLSKATR